MDPVSSLPAIASLIVAVATAWLLVWQFGPPSGLGRYAPIDGLRGYLALLVFLHHGCVWYFFLRTGWWNLPPSNLYTHFGQSSVALFFMITGFLFFSKLIDGRTRSIDWLRLFVSRFLRLVPLYLFAMLLLFLIVAYISDRYLVDPLPVLLKKLMQWIGFTVLGQPNLNGVSPTAVIVAGVTWSLPYEWFFYFSLPILALAVRVVPPLPYLAISIASIIGLAFWHAEPTHVASFFGGIAAAFLVRSNKFCAFSTRNISSLVVLGCLSAAVILFPSADGYIQLVLLSIAFALIACGNSLFGILTHPASRTLGEMAYSIYLLHGIVLFTVFYLAIGLTNASEFSVFSHWLLIIFITPLLVLGSYATFRFIESPAMHGTERVTSWLRSFRPPPR